MRNMKALFYLLIITLIFSFLGCQSNYEKGLSYINASKYELAKNEFLKIEANSQDYAKACECINYIEGTIAYDGGNYYKAKDYFKKMGILNDNFKEKVLKGDKDNLTSSKEPETTELIIGGEASRKLLTIEMDEREKNTNNMKEQIEKYKEPIKKLEDSLKSLKK